MITGGDRSSPLFRLTVWRPCRWERQYLDMRGGFADRTSYQESIYFWESSEDFYSTVSSADARYIQEVLEQFDPGQPLSQRSIEEFRDAIAAIDKVVHGSNDTTWSISQHGERLANGNTIQLRQHQLLALRHHLEWVCDIFGSVPDANVTVR